MAARCSGKRPRLASTPAKSVAIPRTVDGVVDLDRRPYEPSDAAAFADLINAIDEHAGGHPGFTAADVASVIAATVPDPRTDSCMVLAPDGTLAAGAVTMTPPQGGFRIDLLGGVHPRWRGRGIGRGLLGQQLTRAAEIHRTEASHAEWEAHAGVVVGDHDAVRLYERFGMTPVRYWFEMVAPTAVATDVTVPDALRVEAYSSRHETELHAAHVEAFGDHWGYQSRPFEEWATMTVRSDSFLPGLSCLAFDGEELAGYVLCYSDADPKRLYIGHVGVRRAWRRRGIAGGLLARALEAGSEVGYSTAGLGVDAESPTGAVGVYERVGFETESRSVTYRKPLRR